MALAAASVMPGGPIELVETLTLTAPRSRRSAHTHRYAISVEPLPATRVMQRYASDAIRGSGVKRSPPDDEQAEAVNRTESSAPDAELNNTTDDTIPTTDPSSNPRNWTE